MTQDIEKQEKIGFVFPKDEPLLIVRPCLLKFCRNIYPAAKLLSTLLYHARKCKECEPTFTIYRTQEQLVKDMCGDVSEKTLHDIAVPTLQLAGFLDLEEHLKSNRYTIDLIVVRKALSLYAPNQESQPQLEKFLIGVTQLEKFLIEKPSQLEKSLIDKKYFLSQLEKVLIRARNISNCPRGRKRNAQAASDGKFQNTENKRDIRDITLENNSVLSSDENTPSHHLSNLDELFSDKPHQGNAQIIHPEHSFITLDDLIHPTVMVVTLTPAFPHPFYSEMEDKRRERIAAWEVLPIYKKQGLEVEVRWEHETERQTVDAASTIVEQGDIHAVTSRDIDASRYPADLRHSDNIHPHSVLEDHTKVELSSTVVDGGNHHADADTMAPDHNASSEPPNRPKTGIVESQPVSVPAPSVEAPKTAVQTQETSSSIQAVKDLSNQATEQQQASGDDLIANGTTNNQPAENPPATKKSRGGKSAAAKEEKPKKEITGSKEALAIVDMYISLFRHPIPLTQSMVDEAEKLVPCHPTSEDINGCRLWCYASNPDWYGKNGKTKGRVTMKDIVNNWAGWVASQEAPATGFQVPDELKDRVAGVYAALNEWRASKTGDTENVFVPDTESDQAICNLLQKGKRPTKKRMNAVCEAIWETPRNAKTGYLQREHMTVKMICLTYREREIDIVAKEQETQGPKNIVDLFDANRTFGNGLTYLPGALPVVAKSSVVMEG